MVIFNYHFTAKSIYLTYITVTQIVQANEYSEALKCTYFGAASSRVAEHQSGLGNCSWYSTKACCKRTEVTSIFSDMLPLYQATEECAHHMNYLMCYFCSPFQYRWYKEKATVCSKFCEDVYKHCSLASYNGTAIGEAYDSGVAFCKAQNFDVAGGTSGCFAYDPDVFGGGQAVSHSAYILTGLIVLMAV